jgi:hypothetical protein
MVVRWIRGAIAQAEKRVRRIQGWRNIKKLVRVLDAAGDIRGRLHRVLPKINQPSRRSEKINRARDNPHIALNSD